MNIKLNPRFKQFNTITIYNGSGTNGQSLVTATEILPKTKNACWPDTDYYTATVTHSQSE